MVQSHHRRSVGRPREFDEDAALESAMGAFWHKGYEATTLSDLCQCTGLHKGSLYQAFGDKKQLFMRSLERYSETTFKEVAAVAFQSDSPLENVRAVVNEVCSHAGDGKGCLMINSLVELAPHDSEVKAALQKVVEKRLRMMTDLITKAQQAGEVRANLEPFRLARQLMMSMAGFATTVKGFLSPAQGMKILNDLIDSWT